MTSESKVDMAQIKERLQLQFQMNKKLDWFHERPHGERGVVAREEIKEGELLVQLPPGFYFCPLIAISSTSHSNELDHPVITFLNSLNQTPSSFLSTVLLLLHEKGKGKASKFFDYIHMLPQPENLSTLIYWSETEKAELKGTAIDGEGALPVNFNDHVLPILQARPDLWSPQVRTLEEFKWASAIMTSRAYIPKYHNKQKGIGPFLLPIIDMCNHDSKEETGRIGYDDNTETFILTSLKDMKAGEEIFLFYGKLSNAQFLHSYGFTLNNNIEDVAFIETNIVIEQCKIMLQSVTENNNLEELELLPSSSSSSSSASLVSSILSSSSSSSSTPEDFFQLKRNCLESAGFLPAHGYVIKKEKESVEDLKEESDIKVNIDFIPANLFTAIIVFLMPTRLHFDEYAKNPILLSTTMIYELDPSSVIQFYQTLLCIIEAKFKAYPTTLTKDLELLEELEKQSSSVDSKTQTSISSRRFHDALMVRISEKNILTEFKTKCMMHMLDGGEEEDEGLGMMDDNGNLLTEEELEKRNEEYSEFIGDTIPIDIKEKFMVMETEGENNEEDEIEELSSSSVQSGDKTNNSNGGGKAEVGKKRKRKRETEK